MAALPNGLKPLVADYSFGEPGGVLRTEVAGGAARYALDWDRGMQRFSVSFLLDSMQFSVWSAFYHHTIKKGAIAFDMPIDSGSGVSAHSVNIVPGSYSAALTGGVMWSVSLVVEAENQVYTLSESAATDMAGLFNLYGIKPVVSGYGMDEPGGVMRSDVAGGVSRYALDWDRAPQRFQVTLILDAQQFKIWSVFYHRIINKGSIAFDMPLDSGYGISPHSVNILPGSYSAARTGGIMWVVSLVVEAENQVYGMTAAEASSLIDFYALYGAETPALLARIARLATADTRVLA